MRRRRPRISSRDIQYVIAFAVIATIVTSTLFYASLNPPPSEQFFAMWILGARGLAENYYPNDNSTLSADEQVKWTLGVYNHMSGLEYVVVRVKLLNATMPGPDELNGTPSPASPIFEFTRVLVDNETWTIPFTWAILNMKMTDGSLSITGLAINQTPVKGQLGTAVLGHNFRFVFELWSYDENTQNLIFSWNGSDTPHLVWTQIWFNATLTH